MPRLKHRLEYTALRGAAAFLGCLPHRGALAVAWLVAGFAFHVLRFRRRETLRRIRAVCGDDLPAVQARAIAWRSLRNVCFNAVEMMRAARTDLAWVRGHIENVEQVTSSIRSLTERHGGVVVAVPHTGNWDLAGIACHRLGIGIFSVAARQRNPLVNDWLNALRGEGMEVMQRGSGTLRHILARLRGGGALAILPDVRVRQPDLAVPFLGGTANLGRGMAQFARAAGVPIYPVVVSRIGWSRQRFEPLPPVHPDPSADKEADVLRMTIAVVTQFDAAIRRDPGQWFWYNRRWVLEPVEPAAP